METVLTQARAERHCSCFHMQHDRATPESSSQPGMQGSPLLRPLGRESKNVKMLNYYLIIVLELRKSSDVKNESQHLCLRNAGYTTVCWNSVFQDRN